jgi:hypothetical protein
VSVPIISDKKPTVGFYKHASTITIHLMFDTNTSICSQMVTNPF